MDPFTTPPSSRTSRLLSTSDLITHLSKKTIIELIQKIPFDGISVSRSVVNNDQESTASFFEAIGLALIDVLISNSPAKTSPQKLLSSSTSFDALPQEQDTPTKPRVKETKHTASALPRGMFPTIDSNHLGITPKEGRDVSKFDVLPFIDAERRKTLQAVIEDSEQRNSMFGCLTLTRIDPIAPSPRSFAPLQITWDHPRPNFREVSADVQEQRRKALEKLDLTKDPYHIT